MEITAKELRGKPGQYIEQASKGTDVVITVRGKKMATLIPYNKTNVEAVAAQRPFATWHETLGEPTVADAICDRLFSNAEKIELKGESLGKTSGKA